MYLQIKSFFKMPIQSSNFVFLIMQLLYVALVRVSSTSVYLPPPTLIVVTSKPSCICDALPLPLPLPFTCFKETGQCGLFDLHKA